MANLNNDLLRRLQSTIQSWGDEVTGAHAELAGQIQETRGQLETLSRLLGGNGLSADAVMHPAPHLLANGNGGTAHANRPDELEEARSQIAALSARIEPMTVEMESLRRRETQLAASNQSLTSELAELRPQVEQHRQDHSFESRRILEIEDALRRREADVDEAQAESDLLLRRVADRDNELEAVRASSALTAEVLAETEERLGELQEEYDVLQRESEEQASELRRVRSEMDALREALDAQDAAESTEAEGIPQPVLLEGNGDADALRRAEDEIQELLSQIERLQQTEDSLTRELNESRRDSATTLAELGDIQDRLSRVKMERDAYFEETRSLAEDSEVLKSKLEQAELQRAQERETHEADLADLTRSHSEQETRLADARLATARLEENASAAAERTQELQRRLGEIEHSGGAGSEGGNSLRREIETLRESNSELAREVAIAQERTALLEAEIRSATMERQDIERDLDAERAGLERLQAEWNAERGRLLAQVTELESTTAAQAAAGIETLRSELERQERSAAGAIADRDRLTREFNELRAQFAAKENDFREREAAAQALMQQSSKQHADVGEIEERLQAAEASRASLRAELELAQADSTAARERIVELEAVVQRKEVALKAVEESLANGAENSRERQEAMAASLRAAEEAVESLRADLSRSDVERVRLSASLAEAQEAHAELRTKKEHVEREARGAEQDASMASQALHVNRVELDRLRRELRETDQQRAKYREEASELAGRLERERTNVAKQEAEIRAMQVEMSDRALALRQKQKEFDEYVLAHQAGQDASHEELVLELSTAKARANTEVEAMREQVAQLQAMVREVETAPPSVVAEAVSASTQEEINLPDVVADLELDLLRREQEIIELNAQIEERDLALETFQKDFEALLLTGDEEDAAPDSVELSFGDKTEIAALRHALEERDAEVRALRTASDAGGLDEGSFERIEVAAYDQDGKKKAIGEILVSAHLITNEDLESALDEQQKTHRAPLGRILVEKGLIREEVVAQVVAKQLKLPFCDLKTMGIDRQAARLISGSFATSHMCIPTTLSDLSLTVAMANPMDQQAIQALALSTERTIQPVMAAAGDISSAIAELYGAEAS